MVYILLQYSKKYYISYLNWYLEILLKYYLNTIEILFKDIIFFA